MVLFATRGSFGRSYLALPQAEAAVRRDVTSFAAAHGATDKQLESVRTAVSEALANAVVHAYRTGPGEVHVTAAVTGDELWILVADDGCGFQKPTEKPGLGWGLALIAHAADDFVLAERAEGGTEVRMRFHLGDRDN